MLSDEQVWYKFVSKRHLSRSNAQQERAWYDSHRSSLIPEADAEDVFEQVKSGAKTKSRPRERGLTVRHLVKFFDATSWSGFDDSETVMFLCLGLSMFQFPHPFQFRVTIPCTGTCSPVSLKKNRLGMPLPTFPVSGIRTGFGTLPRRIKILSRCFTISGFLFLLQKIFLGQIDII